MTEGPSQCWGDEDGGLESLWFFHGHEEGHRATHGMPYEVPLFLGQCLWQNGTVEVLEKFEKELSPVFCFVGGSCGPCAVPKAG